MQNLLHVNPLLRNIEILQEASISLNCRAAIQLPVNRMHEMLLGWCRCTLYKVWIHPKSHVFTLSCNTIECRQKKYHIIIDASSSQFFTSLTIFILSSSFVLFEVLSWRIVKCPVCAHWCWFNLISRLRAAAFQVRIIKWKTAQSRSSIVNSFIDFINIYYIHATTFIGQILWNTLSPSGE